MPAIIIRIYPIEPMTGADLTQYITVLTITAYDISFTNVKGDQSGQTQYLLDRPQNRIVQHLEIKTQGSPLITEQSLPIELAFTKET